MPRRKPTKKEEPKHVTREEAIVILEEIARNSGNAAARIAAIKQLEAMRDGDRSSAQGGFSDLDQEVPRIRRKAA